MTRSTYPATRESWKTIPLDNPRPIEIRLRFTPAQYEKVVRGLIPAAMEDKWFIFFEEGWLHLHRSWTGHEMYRAEVTPEEDHYVIKLFFVESNHEKYSNTDDKQDVRTFMFLISNGLLKESIATGTPASPDQALRDWSQFGRMMFPENKA